MPFSHVVRRALAAFGLSACASSPQGMMMNQFIPDEKLARVRVCATTGQELVQSFGAPSGQGRDGDMGTLTWNAAAVVHDSEVSAVGTQSVHAFIDSEGLVAAFVVNPTSIPQKPAPCREQQPADAPAPAPETVEKPKQARALPVRTF